MKLPSAQHVHKFLYRKECSMDSLDILDEAFGRPSIIIDENKLSIEYLPRYLPFRDKQLKTLVRYFGKIFQGQLGTRRVIITGPVGSGKTSVSKKFGQWLLQRAKKDNFDNLRYIHVNCRRSKTPFMILLNIARELNSKIASRGYAADELLEMIVEILETEHSTLVLVLDEIEYIIHKGGVELLYALTRTSDDRQNSNHNIVLILIARSSNFLNYLDTSTNSSLGAPIISCPPYKKEELMGILSDRISECFTPNSVSDEAAELIADIAAKRGGDARHALELLLIAGKYADSEESPIVYPEHVRKAKSNVDPSLLRETLKDLPVHKLLLLYGISRRLRQTKAAYVTTGEAEHAYILAAEEFGLKPRKHTQIWEYLQELELLGIIHSQKSSVGQRGNTKHISIQDTSAYELEQELIPRLETISIAYRK